MSSVRLRAPCSSSTDFVVVGEAADGAEAVVECARLHPDVVLLDVLLPGEDGFEIAHRLVVDGAPAVVLTSTRDASAYARRLATTPARGFVPKQELSGEAIARILDSGSVTP